LKLINFIIASSSAELMHAIFELLFIKLKE